MKASWAAGVHQMRQFRHPDEVLPDVHGVCHDTANFQRVSQFELTDFGTSTHVVGMPGSYRTTLSSKNSTLRMQDAVQDDILWAVWSSVLRIPPTCIPVTPNGLDSAYEQLQSQHIAKT